MMEIEMPKISVEESENQSHVKIVVEPLEKVAVLKICHLLRRTLVVYLRCYNLFLVETENVFKHLEVCPQLAVTDVVTC